MMTCERCGAPADGIYYGRQLCVPCMEALTAAAASGCRRCGGQVLVRVAHGLLLCGPCYGWYQQLRNAADQRGVTHEGHPELADVAAVYADAARHGLLS